MMRGRVLAVFVLSLPLILSCGRRIPTTGDEGMGRIKGIVVSEEGIPVGGAEVTLVERGETWITDAGGSFMIPDLPLGNMYSVLIRQGRKGAFFQGIIVDGEVDLGRITIKDGGSIRGQVVGDFEDEFSDAEIYLMGAPFSCKVGEDGRFRIEWVPEGSYRVILRYMEREAEVGEVDVFPGKEADIGRKGMGRTRLAVLYRTGGGDKTLKVMGLDGGDAKELLKWTTPECEVWWSGDIALSPDGKKIAVRMALGSGIWVIDIDTGERREVASIVEMRRRASLANPSGSPKAFTPPPFPRMFPLSDVNEIFVPVGFSNLSWTPDGRWISAVLLGGDVKDGKAIKRRQYAVVLNPNGPPDQDPLVASMFDNVQDVAWNPKGDAIAVVNVEEDLFWIYIEGKDKVLMRIPGGSERLSSICWSPDGRKICYYNYFTGTTVVDVDNGSSIPFVSPTGWGIKAMPVGFTPGGKRIFIWTLSSGSGGHLTNTLWAVRVDGSDQVKILESSTTTDFRRGGGQFATQVSIGHIW